MIDTTTPEGRAVAAALRLAEKRSWRHISLLEIADEAGLTLAELSRHAASKMDLLRAFVHLVDDEVLRKVERGEPEESLRDRLFDVVMTRFDAMAPYKAALRRIVADASFAPQLVPAVLTSQGWMLVAAGISTEGIAGTARVAGLASVYAATFRDWLAEDDAGMARTMAGLDRRLRRGEGWIKSFDSVAATGEGLLAQLRHAVAHPSPAGPSASADPVPPAAATPTSPVAATQEAPAPSATTALDQDPEPPNGSSSVH